MLQSLYTFLIFFLLILSGSIAWAQCPSDETLEFNTQMEIDSFIILYPDCENFPGNIHIQDSAPASMITNLNGLINLKSVDGFFSFENLLLTDLTGLDSLTSIGGSVWFEDNELGSLNGLQSLTTIGGNFYIQDNTINTLSGLENLHTIGEQLYIQFNFNLTNLAGLDNLNSIGTI